MDWKKQMRHINIIPQRYILSIMCFFAVVNALTMRVSLSIALTEMAVSRPSSNRSIYFNECPGEALETKSNITKTEQKYDWSESTQGIILSSFYWGYIVTHIPGGILADKFGGKYTLGLGILCTALLTLIIPWVIILTQGNWKLLVMIRVLSGLGEGITFPALNAILAHWILLRERSVMGTLVYSGTLVGTVLSNFVSGILIEHTRDWSPVFFLFGSVGVLWFILWTCLCYSTPEEHPFMKDEERRLLRKKSTATKESFAVPWRDILTAVPVWALIMSQIGHDWGFFTMITDLPKYMKDVLKFDVEDNGIWSSVPYIVMWMSSMFFGWFCDYLINREILSITNARKIFTFIAGTGPAVFIILASYSGCDRMLAVSMFTIGMGLMGTFYCGTKVNALDLSSNYAGTLMAVVNGIGALTGIITPFLTGILTESHSLVQWRMVFWITFGLLSFSSTVFLLFGSGEEQWWNDPKRNRLSRDGASDYGTSQMMSTTAIM